MVDVKRNVVQYDHFSGVSGKMGRVAKIADQFVLRLPDGLRDQLKKVAEANGRSMNTEIVSRIEYSFEIPPERYVEEMRESNSRKQKILDLELQTEELRAELAVRAQENDVLRRGNEELRVKMNIASSTAQDVEEPIFNIVLDAKGHPISWPEIAAHIHRTAKAAGLETVSFRAAVFNAGRATDSDRDVEYGRLVRWYQEQTRKHKDQIREVE